MPEHQNLVALLAAQIPSRTPEATEQYSDVFWLADRGNTVFEVEGNQCFFLVGLGPDEPGCWLREGTASHLPLSDTLRTWPCGCCCVCQRFEVVSNEMDDSPEYKGLLVQIAASLMKEAIEKLKEAVFA